MEIKSNQMPSYCAYLAAGTFAVVILLSSASQGNVATPFVGILFHLLLFPVVASLPSAEWSRAAGYGWLILDMTSDMLLINGVDPTECLALRYSAHLPAAVWIITSSLRGDMVLKVVGVTQALLMAGFSLLPGVCPPWVLYISAVLLIVWLILVGRLLAKVTKPIY